LRRIARPSKTGVVAARLRDPSALAAELLLLMDGAWVVVRMFGPNSRADVSAALVVTTFHSVHTD
jgi:hypothetical protein